MIECTLNKNLLPALRITLAYLLVGVLWIALSDHAVDLIASTPAQATLMQTWKGWFYVVATGLLLFVLIRSSLRRLEREMQEQQRLSRRLLENERVQSHLLAELADVVWLYEIGQGRMLFISAAVERIYGRSSAEFVNNPETWFEAVHPEDKIIVIGKKQMLDDKGEAELRYRIVRPGGETRWIRDRTRVLKNVEGAPTYLIGIATDITEPLEHAEHIHRLSNYDALTGLPNQMMLERLLGEALQMNNPERRLAALLCVDVAGFKDVNDSYGRRSGDMVLRMFAERLRLCTGARDVVARMGADEFAVFIPDMHEAALAGMAAQRILSMLTAPFELPEAALKLGASVGISLYPEDAVTPDLLLHHADLALHNAKRLGAGSYSFYQESMNAEVSARVSLTAELHHAVSRAQLQLYYQPQIDLRSGRVVAVEALLRWQHPQLGLIPPARFIPLAEDSGLIVTIGAWVLQEACRQNRAWQQAGLPPLVMAINLSAVQCRDGKLPETVNRALEESGLEARWLELEMTESAIMDGTERILAMFSDFSTRGIQLSIDDFGTGYSSLAYLSRFHVNKLKIDKAFVSGAPDDPRDAAVVGTIIQMAKALQLRVIAEGVETEVQASLLRAYDCDEVQGYLYARPMPAADCEAWLRQHPATGMA